MDNRNRYPKNELEITSTLELNEIITTLSKIEDELQIRRLEQTQMLIHRALKQLVAVTLNQALAKKIENKKAISS